MSTLKKDLHVLLCYKNFGAHVGVSHIGLGVSAMNNAKMLNSLGVKTEILPLKDQHDLRKNLNIAKSLGTIYTHVVVSAPWISTAAFAQVCAMFPQTRFAMNCHSNVGFLQADSRGIELLREDIALENGVSNFHVAANSERLCEFVQSAYGDPCLYLPNLYYLDYLTRHSRPNWVQTGGILRIGIFGATRSLKNILTAVGAALIIHRQLKAQTEIWISTGREDSGEVGRILRAAKALSSSMPGVDLKSSPWCSWPNFRKVVGSMHLLLQPSYTESFNMVSADGAHEGVPSVVSEAIVWAPKEWKADVDDVDSIARAGIALIYDPRASLNGLNALRKHNHDSVKAWLQYLTGIGGHFDPLSIVEGV